MADLERPRPSDRFIISKEKTKNAHSFNLNQAAGPQMPIEFSNYAIEKFENEDLPPTPNDPKLLEALLANSLLLIDNGDYRSAIKLLTNILQRDAHHADAIEWLGYCFHKLGDLNNALKCFHELTIHQPDEYSYAALADVLYEMGHEQEAEIHYKLALSLIEFDSPLLFGIYKNLGNISVKFGDYESAEESYNKAYSLCPHSDVLFVNIGTLELQRGHLENALQHFREAVELNEQNDKAWVGIALIHREKGDFELAIGNIERSLDINPSNKTALKIFAVWSVKDRLYQKAIERLEKYLELHSDDCEVSLLLVEMFYRKGDLPSARLELTRTLSLEPDSEAAQKYNDILYAEMPA